MEKYLRNSILKFAIFFSLLLLSSLLVANLTISSTLNNNSQAIQQIFQKFSGLDISFDRLNFSFFGGITFKNLAVSKDSEEIVFIKELRVYLDLLQLTGKKIKPYKIIAIGTSAYSEVFKYKGYLISKVESLKKPDKSGRDNQVLVLNLSRVGIKLKNFRIFLGSASINKGFVLVNGDINNYNENSFSKATVDFSGCEFSNSSFKKMFFYHFSHKIRFALYLAFMRDDLLVNNIVISSDNFKINGAGIVNNYKKRPNFDIKLITTPLNLRELVRLKSKIVVNGLLSIITNIKGGMDVFNLYTEMLMSKGEFYLPRSIVRLNNVFCNIHFRNGEIIIKELGALVNYRFPVLITGRVKNLFNPEFSFVLESHKTMKSNSLTSEAYNFVAKITAFLQENRVRGNADLEFSLIRQLPKYESRKEIACQLGDLGFAFKNEFVSEENKNRSLDLEVGNLLIQSKLSVNKEVKSIQNLELSNIVAKFIFTLKKEIIKFQAQCLGYGGSVNTSGQLDLSSKGTNSYLMTKFSGLSISNLKSLYPMYSDISGVLNGWLYLKNDKTIFLEGAVSVKNATISKFNLLDNIGDFLGIASIKELSDIFMFAAFDANASGTNIKRLNLHNKDLDFESKITINQQGWFSGIVRIDLAKHILEESHILKTLMSMAKERRQRVDFDFRVSGFPNALRLELLEGEFRDRLMRGLSGAIRSQIEKEVDKAIKQFREKSSNKGI